MRSTLSLCLLTTALVVTTGSAPHGEVYGELGFMWTHGSPVPGAVLGWTYVEVTECPEWCPDAFAEVTTTAPWGEYIHNFEFGTWGMAYAEAEVPTEPEEEGLAYVNSAGAVCWHWWENGCLDGEAYQETISFWVYPSPPPPPPPPPPAFKLFLDVDGDFSTTAPSSDDSTFVPGSGLNLDSVELPQVVHLVAAYVNESNQVVAPPSVGSVLFTLTEVSKFKGIAMNASHPQRGDDLPDIVLGSASTTSTNDSISVNFDPSDNTARVDAVIWDYAGFARVTAQHAGLDPRPSFRLPNDNDNNWLPDRGWKTWAGDLVPDDGQQCVMGTRQCDKDYLPEVSGSPEAGVNGDGFTQFEEFRGFMVRETHRRTNPIHKDVFISSTVSAYAIPLGIRHAYPALPTATHRVFDPLEGTPQYDPDSNTINFNFQNTGFGGNIKGRREQAAIRVVQGLALGDPFHTGMRGQNYGCVVDFPTFPNCSESEIAHFPLIVKEVQVNVDLIILRSVSWWSYDEATQLNAIRRTIGHEVGHAVFMPHAGGPTVVSLMNTGWDQTHPMPAPDTGGVGFGAYRPEDIVQIRLHPFND